jgi:hypothetical protein
MKRILTAMTVLLLALILCVVPCFAAAGFDGEVDLEAMARAMGLTEEELLRLADGELDFNDVDLSQIDLGAVVEAAGMTEEEVIDTIEDSLGLGDDVLSDVSLSEIDVGALVEAAGLTADDLNGLVSGELDPSTLDLSQVDPQAMTDAIGLSGGDLLDIALYAAGMGDLDWRGILSSAGRGALVGLGAGVVVVVIIVVLLCVIGRKKRIAHKAEQPVAENPLEE